MCLTTDLSLLIISVVNGVNDAISTLYPSSKYGGNNTVFC